MTRSKYASAHIRHDAIQIWSQLLRLISAGSSLPAALQQLPDPQPSLTWCRDQLRADSALRARYQEAIEDRADYLADELVALADTLPPADLPPAAMSAWVTQLKLRVWARTWVASKLRPRAYGEKIEIATEHRISITAALEEAQARVIDLECREVHEID